MLMKDIENITLGSCERMEFLDTDLKQGKKIHMTSIATKNQIFLKVPQI